MEFGTSPLFQDEAEAVSTDSKDERLSLGSPSEDVEGWVLRWPSAGGGPRRDISTRVSLVPSCTMLDSTTFSPLSFFRSTPTSRSSREHWSCSCHLEASLSRSCEQSPSTYSFDTVLRPKGLAHH